MCGIAGILNIAPGESPGEHEIRRMIASIRHRGPDQFGIYRDANVALGSARLSIIDVSAGQQPISNEDGTLWIVFNGEIFNYAELRPELQAKGHRFKTQSDTEVLLHLFEEYGPDCLQRLNGQFAVAIWNRRDKSLFLARDRLGVRPLFYSLDSGRLLFGSEIKEILPCLSTAPEIDPITLEQVFTYWSPLPTYTVFRGVFQIPPGHYMMARRGNLTLKQYWELSFPGPDRQGSARIESIDHYLEQFTALLSDSTRIRLRADVPVGAYLSGGLDSSVIASVVRNLNTTQLNTFSIAFSDPQFDESAHQQRMAEYLGTRHEVAHVAHSDIARVFPDVIWHVEVPILRTAPAPMYLLSKLVRNSGFKVVLTGEGADEFLGGYDIFKESKIRRFWARQPASTLRPLLLKRLYGDIPGLSSGSFAMLSGFFKRNLEDVTSPTYSHDIRWNNNRRTHRFFSEQVLAAIRHESKPDIRDILPAKFTSWSPLAQAQCMEIKLFMSGYLLSSQGDRVAMANSIEGRFPFLDKRLVQFCNNLPPNLKLHGLTEKYLLRQFGRSRLPDEILSRTKRPYRAPIHRSFFAAPVPDYVRDLLSPGEIKRAGLFKAEAVEQLVRKVSQGGELSETDDMALVGIISTQLLQKQFIDRSYSPAPLSASDPVKVCYGPELKSQETHYGIHPEYINH